MGAGSRIPHEVKDLAQHDHQVLIEHRPGNPSGIAVQGPEFECEWAPVIGPTCTLLLRRMVELDGMVDLDDLGRSVGVDGNPASSGVLMRSIARLARYRLLRFDRCAIVVTDHVPVVDFDHHDHQMPSWLRAGAVLR